MRGASRWKLAVVLALLAGSQWAEAGPVTIWQDGVDSGSFDPAWTKTGAWTIVTSSSAAHDGTRGVDITGPTSGGGDVLELQVSTVGYQDIEFTDWSKVRAALESTDSLVTQVSTDGGQSWQNLKTYANLPAGDWSKDSFPLPIEADNNPNLEIRLWATFDSGSDRTGFDTFVLSGTPVPEPSAVAILGVGAASLALWRRRFLRFVG